MRVTENMRVASALEMTQSASARLEEASRAAASGDKLGAPSDDPALWGETLKTDSRVALLQGRAKTAGQAADDLGLAESSLAQASDVFARAREIAVEMSNGTMDAASRASAAKEVDSLEDTLLSIANTRGANGYLFGGLKTDAAPFDPSGKFLGDAGTRSVEVADGKTAVANASGALTFTVAGGRDVFGDLAALSTALKANNVAGVQASIDAIDASSAQVGEGRTTAGLAAERLRSVADVASSAVTQLQTSRAGLAEVDAPTAYSNLQLAQEAVDRAIAVTQKILARNVQSG